MAETVVRVTPEQLGINVGSSYDRQLDYDLANLAAFDATPVDAAAFRNDTEAACLDIASRMTQSLIAQLFSLPKTSDARVVALPAATTKLPRGKAVPKPKPMTKWQKFAQDKGLTRSTKRSSMVWDENSQDWKRRHGYERGNDPSAVPIIEASSQDLPGEDPFTRLDREKAERIGRNKRNEAGNLADAQKVGALPSTIKLSTKLDANSVRGQIAKGKALSGDLKNASYLAGVSTASMGKFDKRLRGEKEGERTLPGKRAKHVPLTDGAGEKEASGKVLGKLMRRADAPLLNTEKAVKKLQGSKDDGDGDDEDSRRKKGRHGRVKNRRVPKKDKRLAAGGGSKKKASSGGKKGGPKKR